MAAVVDLFVHIPKTAGTTLRRIIDLEYPRGSVLELKGIDRRDRPARLAATGPEIRAITGHVHFGQRLLVPRPLRIFTMLREPVARMISLYYFLERESRMANHNAVKTGALTVLDLARRQNSLQTRFIAGCEPREVAPDEQLLAEAKRNLEHEFVTFGLTERFDESLLLFRQALGWSVRGYARENVTRPKRVHADKAAELREQLAQILVVDCELYRFASELFAGRVAAQPPGFADELAALRRNITVARGAKGLRSVWQKLTGALGGKRSPE